MFSYRERGYPMHSDHQEADGEAAEMGRELAQRWTKFPAHLILRIAGISILRMSKPIGTANIPSLKAIEAPRGDVLLCETRFSRPGVHALCFGLSRALPFEANRNNPWPLLSNCYNNLRELGGLKQNRVRSTAIQSKSAP